MPLREHNALLIAAGYAPKFSETPLATQELAPVRKAIEFILAQQEPYPALVMNRYWDVLMMNQALVRVFGKVRGRAPLHGNILRQIFDPNDMKSCGSRACFRPMRKPRSCAARSGEEEPHDVKEHRRGEAHGVHAIEHATVAFDHHTPVFGAEAALHR
jgi:hypothetical protein